MVLTFFYLLYSQLLSDYFSHMRENILQQSKETGNDSYHGCVAAPAC